MTTDSALLENRTTTPVPVDLPTARVADLAREHPGTIRVFQRHGIDFCCGGKRTVAAASSSAGLDLALLADELRAALGDPGGADAWLGSLPDSLADLGKLIVGRYHVALRGELPRLVQMADRVERVHGAEMPAVLPRLAATVRALSAALDAHMREEEAFVFPAIERLESAARRGQAAPAEDLAVLIAAGENEHAAVGSRLQEMRDLTSGFVTPEWACNTFLGLYHGLAELERSLHEHVHLENNVLFPRALALAAQGGA